MKFTELGSYGVALEYRIDIDGSFENIRFVEAV